MALARARIAPVAPVARDARATRAKTSRRELAGAVALVATLGRCDGARASRDAMDYDADTLDALDAATRVVRGKAREGDRERIDGWYERNKRRYDNATRGKSFLMTTKTLRYAAGRERSETFDEAKFDEWVKLSRALTDGSMSVKEQREAYGAAVWANNDKSDAKNRIGLCAFGATGPTRALGIDCSGF